MKLTNKAKYIVASGMGSITRSLIYVAMIIGAIAGTIISIYIIAAMACYGGKMAWERHFSGVFGETALTLAAFANDGSTFAKVATTTPAKTEVLLRKMILAGKSDAEIAKAMEEIELRDSGYTDQDIAEMDALMDNIN